MELIVVSAPKARDGESIEVIRMFEAGLERFHLRKPGASKSYIKEFIEQIPVKYHNRIIIHSNHSYAIKYKLGGIHISKKHRKKKFNLRLRLTWYRLRNPRFIIARSCHKLADLSHRYPFYSYIFLSPVFESVAVNSFAGGYSPRGLSATLEKSPMRVIAMGGVRPENFQEVADLGFSGVAVLGYIWSSDSPFKYYLECLNALKSLS